MILNRYVFMHALLESVGATPRNILLERIGTQLEEELDLFTVKSFKLKMILS